MSLGVWSTEPSAGGRGGRRKHDEGNPGPALQWALYVCVSAEVDRTLSILFIEMVDGVVADDDDDDVDLVLSDAYSI